MALEYGLGLETVDFLNFLSLVNLNFSLHFETRFGEVITNSY